MSSSLGLYIEDNLIKYAKVSKNNDNIKVESFGIKFYDKPEDAIKQIIEETYSYKIPISTNATDEIYNYFDIFAELKPKDIDGIVKTSFENYCYDNGLNKDSFESRHIQSNSPLSKEKKREICISTKKTSIARRKNQLSGYKISSVSPISVAIEDLIKQGQGQTCIVVNLEENTTITKIGPEGVKDIKVIPVGSKSILEKIKTKENSYSKAYEICKNTSIYTNDAYDLQVEENEFLPDIMPTLFEIVTAVKNYIGESLENVEKVYITGTLSIINNIDIYFQEYIKNIKCEILKPYFVSNNSKINIKDYIEVNSALALALYSLDTKKDSVNFIKESGVSKLFGKINNSERTKLNEIDIWNIIDKNKGIFNAVASLTCSALVIYIITMIGLNTMMNNKQKETEEAITDTNTKISEVSNYNTKLNNRITKYKNMIKTIEDNNDKNSENKRYKNIIPNFMNNIMAVIPKEVQLTSISNTNDTHIVIEATSSKYEQLAYFKTKIKTESVLENVTSDTGVSSGGSIKVTIEGELP